MRPALIFAALAVAGLLAGGPLPCVAAETVWLDELDATLSECGWQRTLSRRAVGGNPLKLDGKPHERGVGTHSPGVFAIRLDGGTRRFTAMVGIDDEVGDAGSAEFKVLGDGRLLWTSGVVRGSDAARAVDVALGGVKILRLVVTVAGDGYGCDHTDWADAKFEVVGARVSKLYALLQAGHYDVELSKADLHRLSLWLDANSDFFGSYERTDAQSRGEIVQPTLE